jgi:DNA-binding NtrC family response regulator
MPARTGQDHHREEAGEYQVLVLGTDQTAFHELPASGSVTIGRSEDADIRITDRLSSRSHASLHTDGGLAIEDLGGASGTFLRDQRLPPKQRVPLASGDAVTIASTLLQVHLRKPASRSGRITPPGHFQASLIEECARAEHRKGSCAVMRLHLDGAAARPGRDELLVDALRPGDLLAAYGPDEYEMLIVDADPARARALGAEIVSSLGRHNLEVRLAIACFPADGASPQALIGRVSELIRGDRTSAATAAPVLVDPRMRALHALAGEAAQGKGSVLIVGETGSGREHLAATVHRQSPRADHPFLRLDCAALPETFDWRGLPVRPQRLDGELFGYEKGAFPGAIQAKRGVLEAASGGTVFLDEIGEMSLALQVKLLRTIETGQVFPVGGLGPRAVDVRLVAATNRDLEKEVAAGRFRQDLYFRLSGTTMAIPPLRERQDEIEPLATLFLEEVSRQGGAAPAFSPETLALLRGYPWPGNLRELRNTVERAFHLCQGNQITPNDFPRQWMTRTSAPLENEKHSMLDALLRCSGNQTRAAELLGMPGPAFSTRLDRHRLPPRPV